MTKSNPVGQRQFPTQCPRCGAMLESINSQVVPHDRKIVITGRCAEGHEYHEERPLAAIHAGVPIRNYPAAAQRPS